MLDFLQKPKEKIKTYWSILIESQWITSAIWQINDGKVEIVSTSPATRWEDNIVEAIDSSLSSAVTNLPEDFSEPSETVFGVSSLWVDGGNIKSEHLETLKKVCQDLSLTPSGFVVLSEAVSHFVKFEEGAPLSGVVVGISDENLDISLFNLGKLLGTTNVSRSISAVDDIVEGISRLNIEVENVPSRILLFNQKEQELEDIKSQINDSDLSRIEGTKFIHTPKVEIVNPDKKILAVCLAGGSEIAQVEGVVVGNDKRLVDAEPAISDESEISSPSQEDFNLTETDELTASDLGFEVITPAAENKKIEPEHSFPLHVDSNKAPGLVSKLPKMPKIPKFNFSFPKLNFDFNMGTKPFVWGSIFLILTFVVGFVMWWFLPKATVSLYVTPKKIEDSLSIEAGKDISTETISVTVDGEKTKSTTGTKTVGEKAKGQVKIQNGTAFPINVNSGTVLLSSSDLKFVTTKTASISGALSPSEPGQATLDVEAYAIGSDYNIAKDEILKVGNYPKAEVDAITLTSFTGGSSRQISAVSDDDRKKILKELKDELTKEGQEKLSGKVSSTDRLISSSVETETTEEDYSNKVGDEASNLKLKLTLKINAMTVSDKDLSQKARNVLEDKVPDGFVLRDDQITYSFVNSGDKSFDVSVSANLLPSVDTTDIAKKISGRNLEKAREYLSSIAGFVRAEFRLKPKLPGRLGTLPHVAKNISIEVTSEK